MSKTDASKLLEWRQNIGITAGFKGTATATGATSLTHGGGAGTTAYVGCTLVAGNVYANIISHTDTVFTIDQWYDAVSPGGAAASTPSSTALFVVLPSSPPAMFMGLTADATAVASGDTTLPSEITTGGGGLIRKVGTLSYSSGGSTGTVVAVFTANGSDALPVTIAKEGISPSIKSTVRNLLQTVLNATATLAAIGDQLTITDTITP
jgi:hypothetical protein